MREKKEVARRKKAAENAREAREEANAFDPWGRGGGGAPMRDDDGNVVSILGQPRPEQPHSGPPSPEKRRPAHAPASKPHVKPPQVCYSDEKVANREMRVRHFVVENGY